jgi:CDP-paratose 2-epimerase
MLERLMGRAIPVSYSDWRPGDQSIYVSDIRKAKQQLGWEPKIGVEEGIQPLFKWVLANKVLFEKG